MFKDLEKWLTVLLCCIFIPLLTFGVVAGCCEHENITIITQDDEVLYFHTNDCYWDYDNRNNSFTIGNEVYCNIKYINVEYVSWCPCDK